ncbi:hypothetical protein J6590_047654 [Homalodisca vitripennis]|nr:hypothetical protein J6590_047654 [Homalodisca vitripennis]
MRTCRVSAARRGAVLQQRGANAADKSAVYRPAPPPLRAPSFTAGTVCVREREPRAATSALVTGRYLLSSRTSAYSPGNITLF